MPGMFRTTLEMAKMVGIWIAFGAVCWGFLIIAAMLIWRAV